MESDNPQNNPPESNSMTLSIGNQVGVIHRRKMHTLIVCIGEQDQKHHIGH